MAFDRAARASSAGIGLNMAIWPDATKGQAWRQSVGYGYSGNLVGAPPVVTFRPELARRQFISNPGRGIG